MSCPREPAFALAPARVDVFLTFYEDLQNALPVSQYEQLLPIDERAHASRLRCEPERRQYLAAHVLARTTLSRYFDVRPDEWRFTAGEYGRPEVAHPRVAELARLSFNLTHARGLVAMAVACDRVIGVDVETIDHRRAAGAIARRFFAPGEAAALALLPSQERHERFVEYWTLKESHVKARGGGFAIPLDSFSFDLAVEGAVALSDPAASTSSLEWQFWQWREAPDHVVAVCTGPPRPETKIVAWNVAPMVGVRRHPVRFLRTSPSARIADPKVP